MSAVESMNLLDDPSVAAALLSSASRLGLSVPLPSLPHQNSVRDGALRSSLLVGGAYRKRRRYLKVDSGII